MIRKIGLEVEIEDIKERYNSSKFALRIMWRYMIYATRPKIIAFNNGFQILWNFIYYYIL